MVLIHQISLLRILDNTIMYFLPGMKKFFTLTKTGAQWRQRNKQGIYADSENISALESAKIKFNHQLSHNFYQIFFQGIFINKIQFLQSYYSTTARHSDCVCMQIAVTEYFWSYFCLLWQQSYYSYIICLYLFIFLFVICILSFSYHNQSPVSAALPPVYILSA